MTEQESEFWSPLGEGFWKEAQATTGATDLQMRFAVCRHRGMTATGAARAAGYSGDDDSIRQAGSRAAKTTAVMELLALAVAEAGGGTDGIVDSAEARRILSRLARGSDPNVRIKALESLNKLQENEQSTPTEELSPEAMLKVYLQHCRPQVAPLIWCEFILVPCIWHAPGLRDFVPYLAKYHPDDWQAYRQTLLGPTNQLAADVDKLEKGPLLSLDEILARVGVNDAPAQLKTAEANVVEGWPNAAA